jgi:hypothetical protein
MSDAASLLRRYNTELMSSRSVRQLMSSVSQDAQNETISYRESMVSVRNAVQLIGPDSVGEARRSIIGYINDVYFTQNNTLSDEWWFEMHTRLQKLCVVSMILEGDNLRSFGAIPQNDDIPQALVGVFSIILEKRKLFPMLRQTYSEKVNALREHCSDYVDCYTEK